jgi:putative oxidoreductase
VRKIHLQNGVWNSAGGWEFNAVMAAAAAAVASDGPGVLSVDALFKRSRWGLGGALFAVGAGIAGSFAVTEFAKRAKPETAADDAGAAPSE